MVKKVKPDMEAFPYLRGNPIAALDVETTGRIAGYHEIIQIAIVPLNLDLEIENGITHFNYYVKPEYPERAEKGASTVHGLKLDELIVNAPSQEKVLMYLLEWFSKLPLGAERRLTPLAHNWPFERGFLLPWLGMELMDNLFTPHGRDTMQIGNMLNDRASLIGAEVPFGYVGLKSMCTKMGIPLEHEHDALHDSIATAKLFSALMRGGL